MGRHRGVRRAPWSLALTTGLVALALLAAGSPTRSGWAAGSVANSTDSAVGAAMAITHSYASTSCATTARVTAVTCPATLGTSASPASSRADSITNNGTVAVSQQVTGSSCAPVALANAASPSDPLLPRNSVTFRQTDKWGTSSAAGFSGSGYATDPIGTSGSGLLGLLQSSFSFGVWFKASDALGGGLLSLSGSLSNGAGGANPTLWLDQSGNVHAYVATTLAGTQVASSGTNYGDGAWHLAVVVVSTPILLTGVTLYVDGVSKASSGGLSLLTSTTGYWHLAWSSFAGLTAPTSAYFHGSLSGAFVAQGALSGGTVSTLAGAASAAAYQSTLGSNSPVSTWMLGDDGVTTYPGTSLPAGNLFDPCAKVNLTWTFASPAASIAAQSLKAFANGSPTTVAAPGVSATQSLTIATSQGTGYTSDLAGLHLYVPISFGYAVGSAWTQTMTWSGDPTEVFWG